jgi:hypothetical protein
MMAVPKQLASRSTGRDGPINRVARVSGSGQTKTCGQSGFLLALPWRDGQAACGPAPLAKITTNMVAQQPSTNPSALCSRLAIVSLNRSTWPYPLDRRRYFARSDPSQRLENHPRRKAALLLLQCSNGWHAKMLDPSSNTASTRPGP